jgi:hypothetical protein
VPVAGSTDGRSTSAIFGIVMVASGVALFIGGFHERHHAQVLRGRGVVVDGTVAATASESQVQLVGGVFLPRSVQRVLFDFEDLQGRPHRTTMRFLATSYEVGQTVRLVYDPGALQQVDVFESCGGWFSCDRAPVASMAMGSLVCLFAAALVVAEFRGTRAAQLRR